MGVPLTVMLLMWIYSLDRCVHCMLQLSSYPALASLGMSYTMSCSSNSSGGRARSWYRDGDIILRTRYVSLTQCVNDVANENVYRRLSGRITVSCSNNLYNLTLLISASDSGSAWWCRDDVAFRTSNTLTIILTTVVTGTSVTSPPPTPATPPTPPQSTPYGGVYIGAGVGGGVVVIVVVSVLCMRRKRGRPVHNGLQGNSGVDDSNYMETGSTSYANLDMNDGQETNNIILVENDLYEGSSDVTPFHQPPVNVPVNTGHENAI